MEKLNIHHDNVHKYNGYIFKCTECDSRWFRSKIDLENHYDKDHNPKKYKIKNVPRTHNNLNPEDNFKSY